MQDARKGVQASADKLQNQQQLSKLPTQHKPHQALGYQHFKLLHSHAATL
jgi:hypothetical protein